MKKVDLTLPDTLNVSQSLANVIGLSLSRALLMGRMFTPSLLVEKNGKRENYVFDVGRSDKGVEQAREFAKKLHKEVVVYAITYDGFVNFENKKFDAMICEAGERGQKEGIVFFQLYKDDNFLFIKKVKPIGNAIFKEKYENYFKV